MVLASGLTACASNPPDTALLPGVDVAIRRWLLCEECSEGELKSVLAYGDRAVDPLKEALDGPPQERMENMRRQAIYLYARATDDTIAQARYAERSVANYVATYQRRAVVALDSIDTPLAHQALIDAVRQGGYRDDVLRLLGEAASTVLSRVQGDSQHAFYDSLVSIDPTVEVRDSASQAVLGDVRVRFLVDSGGGSLTDADSLTNAAGRASVRWRLGAADSVTDSVNVLRASAAGRSVRFRAFGRPVALRLVFLVQPTSTRRGEPMVPPVRIAVQDAMGTTQVTPGHPGEIRVDVVGTSINMIANLVDGVAELSGLEILTLEHGLRLRATRLNTVTAVSDTFSIVP